MAKKKIILIDDSQVTLTVFKDMLEKEGYDVITSNTGEEGVKKTELEKPDLAVIDTVLGGIDGFEVCRRIREAQVPPSELKIIITTGTVDAIDAVKAKRLGADDYVVKTADFSLLVKAIKTLLDKVIDK